MTSSGRCHGPGCTQTAVVEGGWCSELCVGVWQWAKSRREIADLAPMDEPHFTSSAEPAAEVRTAWDDLADARDEFTEAVKSEVDHYVDLTRGWLSRALDRLFGRTK